MAVRPFSSVAPPARAVREKATVTSRQRTWLSLTTAGRAAVEGHGAELQRVLAPEMAGLGKGASPT